MSQKPDVQFQKTDELSDTANYNSCTTDQDSNGLSLLAITALNATTSSPESADGEDQSCISYEDGNVRKRTFSDAEKSETYWDKRKRNNEAARKSREKRRQINLMLESKLSELNKENDRLKSELENYKNDPADIPAKPTKNEPQLPNGDEPSSCTPLPSEMGLGLRPSAFTSTKKGPLYPTISGPSLPVQECLPPNLAQAVPHSIGLLPQTPISPFTLFPSIGKHDSVISSPIPNPLFDPSVACSPLAIATANILASIASNPIAAQLYGHQVQHSIPSESGHLFSGHFDHLKCPPSVANPVLKDLISTPINRPSIGSSSSTAEFRHQSPDTTTDQKVPQEPINLSQHSPPLLLPDITSDSKRYLREKLLRKQQANGTLPTHSSSFPERSAGLLAVAGSPQSISAPSDNSFKHCLNGLKLDLQSVATAQNGLIVTSQLDSSIKREITPESGDGAMGSFGKDGRYLERRKRNNEAAKRCRANRRALFEYRFKRSQELEAENVSLRKEISKLSQDLSALQEMIKARGLRIDIAMAAQPIPEGPHPGILRHHRHNESGPESDYSSYGDHDSHGSNASENKKLGSPGLTCSSPESGVSSPTSANRRVIQQSIVQEDADKQ